jgi:hypothetical protein
MTPDLNLELARELDRLAADLTPSEMMSSGDRAGDVWRLWCVGFVLAGRRLFQAIVVLTERGLGHESTVLLRALAECVANQYFMGVDPQRAIEFSAAESGGKRRLLEAIEKYGLSTEADRAFVAERIEEDASEMREFVGDALDDARLARQPFGLSARDRMVAAGLDWQYDLVYRPTSDLLHMNAIAVAHYLREQPEPGMSQLAIANELMLRLLYKLDEAHALGRQSEIDGLSRMHAGAALPSVPPEVVVERLRPTS